MIAGSDRASPVRLAKQRGRKSGRLLRFDSSDDASALGKPSALFGALKAKPPVLLHLPGGFAVTRVLRESALWPVVQIGRE